MASALVADTSKPPRGGSLYTAASCGIGYGVLRSLLQKAIRRGDKAAACAAVAMVWRLLTHAEESTAAVRTNFLNRLAVIAGEDACASVPTVCAVLLALNALRSQQTLDDAMYRRLLQIVCALCEAPKARYPSLARAVASSERPLFRSQEIKHLRKTLEAHNSEAFVAPTEGVRKRLVAILTRVPEARGLVGQRESVEKFLKKLMQPNAQISRGLAHLAGMYCTWAILSEEEQRAASVLVAAYICHNEPHVFLLLALGALLDRCRFLWAPADLESASVPGDIPVDGFAVPAYALDIHTGHGGSLERFACEGAHIENRHPLAHPDCWQEEYIRQKVEADRLGKKRAAQPTVPAPIRVGAAAAAPEPKVSGTPESDPEPARAPPAKKARVAGPSAPAKAKPLRTATPCTPPPPKVVLPERELFALSRKPLHYPLGLEEKLKMFKGADLDALFDRFRDGVLLGQLPTGKAKPATMFVPEAPGLVVKGPYPPSKADRAVFAATALHSADPAYCQVPAMLESKRGAWLVYDSLATAPRERWTTHQRQSITTEHRMVAIVDRLSMGVVRVADLGLDAQVELMGDDYPTYLAGTVLRVGDMGAHNALLRDGRSVLIDLDDMTTHDGFTCPSQVFRAPTAKWREELVRIARQLRPADVRKQVNRVAAAARACAVGSDRREQRERWAADAADTARQVVACFEALHKA